ncbi:centromere protein Q-like [Anomaloglossus baeobatrachus]|uniref:centromere protein Q-like n=1 Tax=Anomaloglossus baeobatrachus TaxID=238106 RepID=UPI003F503D4D
MAPKRQRNRVTYDKTVKSSSDTSVKKCKEQGSEEQSSRKRQRCDSPEDTTMRLAKKRNAQPLQAEVLLHIEACLTVAEMSALSRKKVAATESPDYLSRLKQRLLKFCKDMRFPVTKVHTLKNLAKDILEEQHKMKESEDSLEYLKDNIKEAVDMANTVENSIEALEKMVETLNEQESETSQPQDEILSNIDPLELPQGTFEAPTMQDMAKKLKNPKLILKKLSRVQSNPIYTDAMNLLQMAYAETSTL